MSSFDGRTRTGKNLSTVFVMYNFFPSKSDGRLNFYSSRLICVETNFKKCIKLLTFFYKYLQSVRVSSHRLKGVRIQ